MHLKLKKKRGCKLSNKKWTAAQAAAIEDEGGSLLVSAAAGSGKTAVLVERAVRLITREENPIPADALLIVTFTNAAAEELRARITTRVEQALQEAPGNTALRKQRMQLRRAFIGTVDSLCMQLVREHFAALGLPPDINIGDASVLEELAGAAMAQTLEEMYENPDFTAFSALYGRARSDKEAEAAVRSLFDFTRTLPHPQNQLNRLAQMYQSRQPLPQTAWGQELLAYAQRALQAAQRLLQSAVAIARQEVELLGYIEVLDSDALAIAHMLDLLQASAWDDAAAFVLGYSFPRMPAVRGYEGGGKYRVKALRDAVKKIFHDLKEHCFVCTTEEFEQDRQAAAPMVAALCKAAALFENAFYTRKLEEKVLDFSDFEHLTLSLLQNADGSRTKASHQISARYAVVMVDEYQDTNELQSTIYECLANVQGSNLFYVGDVKQSIYRFRKANPGIFLNKKHTWQPYGKGVHPAVITLGHNFRSGSGVINGVNFVFSAIMSPTLGDIAYNEQEMLIQGTTGGDEAGFGMFITEDAAGGTDCLAVAHRIKAMVAQQYPVRAEQGMRPCRYDDFCVLLRARGHMLEYMLALEAQGIPVVADTSEELLQTPEILPLTATLAAIDNPADDVSLAAALLSPLFGFDEDDLVALRLGARQGHLWGALLAAETQPKVAAFLQTFGYLRARSVGLPVARFCEEIIEQTGYLAVVSAMEGGPARRENVYRFISWAAEVTRNGRGGLSAFVRVIGTGRGPASPSVKGLPGHVTVLTIHKSKGLEYPICILADAARGFNRMDLNQRIQMHTALGIGLQLRAGDVLYPTAMQMAVRSRLAAETMSEEMRVLYVALTRAKDNMLISFSCKDATKLITAKAESLVQSGPDAYLLGKANSYAEWLVTALLCHPDATPLLHYASGVIPKLLPAKGKMCLQVQPAQAVQPQKENEFTLNAAPQPDIAATIAMAFTREPVRQRLAQVPRKMSVSALAKKQEMHIPSRPAFMYKSGLTAAERGSAQHAFMQYADFEAAKTNLEDEIARLGSQGHLPAEWQQNVDRKTAAAFFASPLFKRVENARQVLRECDFFTTVPARMVQPDLQPPYSEEPVLVQGIADLVLVNDSTFEIVDYKTDRKVTPTELVQRYQGQLQLYARALSDYLAMPVGKLTIWSFSLGQEVDVPLG